jgi:hypothetical protein
MIDYQEAQKLIAESAHEGRSAEVISLSGGLKRWAWFIQQEEGVEVRLFGHLIAMIYPQGWIIWDCGYQTATTREALSVILPGNIYSADFRWFYCFQDHYSKYQSIPYRSGIFIPHPDQPRPVLESILAGQLALAEAERAVA